MKDTKDFIHLGFKNEPVQVDEYESNFGTKNKMHIKERSIEVAEAALDRAWKNRDFEIELYWKRAAYFWTFIGVAFVGYTAIVTSETISKSSYQLEFLVTCLGFFSTLIWLLANEGSKKWQENWEYHIEMLENLITGPLYKTVKSGPKFSVSRLNKLLNQFILLIWFLLGLNYFFRNKLYIPSENVDVSSWIIFIFTCIFSICALFIKTRTKDDEPVGFTLRERNLIKH